MAGPTRRAARPRAPRDDHALGRIGPNAVIQLAAALGRAHGPEVRREVFALAGLERRLDAPPDAMVAETEVVALHRALNARLGSGQATATAADAGRLTGDYLLANRIPALAQRALRLLPWRLSVRALVRAIGAHAWTFAGTGRFGATFGEPVTLIVSGGPLKAEIAVRETLAAYYAATFHRVLEGATGRALALEHMVDRDSGAPACLMRVRRAARSDPIDPVRDARLP